MEKGPTRLTILSLSKERGSPRGVGNPTPQGEGRFSEQYVYSIMDSLLTHPKETSYHFESHVVQSCKITVIQSSGFMPMEV